MGRLKWLIILILLVAAFGAGFWFKDDVIKLSENIDTGVKEFQKTEIGSIISETGKEIFTPSPLNVGGESNEVVLLKSKIIAETNAQRIANGLPALVENNILDDAATAKANDMFKNQYFEHISPTGVDPGKLVQNQGYEYIVTGENLILGNFKDEADLVQDWMNSEGHRANILNTRYAEIGVSVVKGTYNGETVWISVQEFGLPMSACTKPSESLKTQIEVQQTELGQLSFSIDEKKKEIDNTNKNSSYYSQMINDYNSMVANYNSFGEQLKNIILQYNNQVNDFNQCVNAK